MNGKADEFADYVEHPRYGRGPRHTGLTPGPTWSATFFPHWHATPQQRIAGTALVADTSRQRRSTAGVTHYFDERRVCRVCRRPFLFFAEEQRYWYETLGLPLEADCVYCVDCRAERRDLARLRRRYEELVGRTNLADAELVELLDCAVTLVESRVFSRRRIVERIRAWRNRIPDDSAVRGQAEFRRLLARIERL